MISGALVVCAAYGCGQPAGQAPAAGGAPSAGAGATSVARGGATSGVGGSYGGAEAAGFAGSNNGAGGGASGAAGNSGGAAGADPIIATSPFAKLITQQIFEQMFPQGSSLYSYVDLVHATVNYPDFASDGSDGAKRDAAAFLANVARESIELQYTDEISQGPYCQPADDCPCADGKSYFGRGALQISWNYNYCAAGKDLGLPLLANPELVSSDPQLRWLTGLWFWMTQTSGTSHTPHDAIASDGFGETIRIINGGIECNGPTDPQVQANVADRKNHYLKFTAILGVSVGGSIDC
ncbi:MAG TPA: chitinase [Polyangiaceae bacterium]